MTTPRPATTIRFDDGLRAHVAAYAEQYRVSFNWALNHLARVGLETERQRNRYQPPPITTVGCEYAAQTASPTRCHGPIEHLVEYRNPDTGNPLTRDTVCHAHADEALHRPEQAGADVTAHLIPLALEGVA
jgi:hypothetical protein